MAKLEFQKWSKVIIPSGDFAIVKKLFLQVLSMRQSRAARLGRFQSEAKNAWPKPHWQSVTQGGAGPARRFHSPWLFLPRLPGDIWFALYGKPLLIPKKPECTCILFWRMCDAGCTILIFKPKCRAWTKEKFRTKGIWATKKNPFVQGRNRKEVWACLCPKMSHSVSEGLGRNSWHYTWHFPKSKLPWE